MAAYSDVAQQPSTAAHSWLTRSMAGATIGYGGARRAVRVFDHDPDLLRGLEQHEAAEALAHGVAAVARLEKGEWHPPARGGGEVAGHPGLLVIEGQLARDTTVALAPTSELLGAGDLLRPWQDESEVASLPWRSDWEVLQPATLAILDARFARAVSPWPSIFAALMERMTERQRWLALQLAIGHLRRVDARLLVLLWHLGDRWGTVHADGVHLPIRLTHAHLARLVGAQRPSVTLALTQLTEAGRLRRGTGGTWVLLRPAPDLASLLRKPGGSHRDDGAAGD